MFALAATSVPSISIGPLACRSVKPVAPVASAPPVASSVRLQAWRLTSPPPPFACSMPPTVTVVAVSAMRPPAPGAAPLLSASISPGAVTVSSACKTALPMPHESLLTSIGLLERVMMSVPDAPSVALPPQLPVPARRRAAFTARSPVGSMSTVPPVPPPRSTSAFTVMGPALVKLSSSPPCPPPAAVPLTRPPTVTAPCSLAFSRTGRRHPRGRRRSR